MLVTALATGLVAFFALVVRFRLGFGFSLVVVPAMSIFAGFSNAVLTAIVLEVVVGLLLAWEHRGDLRMGEAIWLKVCGVGGAVVGVAVRELVSLQTIVVSAMSLISLTCALQLLGLRPRLRRSRPLLATAGIASGALNSWTSLSGPPVVLYYLATEDTDERVKGSLSGYFVLLYVVTFALLLADGQYAGYEGGWALVGGLLAVTVGRQPARDLSQRLPGELATISLLLLLITAVVTGVRAL